ncbi:PH domain-containing protein [Actinomadura craniellae]|uniref:PH domain-containing protein n=2 Tax=Actinomadura craniellae TaxID=2231787 RepID=A0A365H0F9_9ACTN|nr:PH domain-containing protein [Actinomadura craniellae]
MVVRDSTSRALDRYLMSHEEHVIAVRRHPAVLLAPVAEVVGGLILAGVIGSMGFPYIWWLWLILVGRLLWRVIVWSIEFFVVTDQRVMLLSGVLNRRVAMMPLGKVDDILLQRSLAGRTLGYGEFVVESAGQDQALRNVNFMPYPEQLYLEVSSMIFGAEDLSPD